MFGTRILSQVPSPLAPWLLGFCYFFCLYPPSSQLSLCYDVDWWRSRCGNPLPIDRQFQDHSKYHPFLQVFAYHLKIRTMARHSVSSGDFWFGRTGMECWCRPTPVRSFDMPVLSLPFSLGLACIHLHCLPCSDIFSCVCPAPPWMLWALGIPEKTTDPLHSPSPLVTLRDLIPSTS